ncbi:MAG: hypothetical protein KIS78_13865 [Labilithrix sp.]|nr:hypothetical protein [Labilithrix sp.]MCW5833485.1 hypothetical protein [Labilithrix sp.]
MGPTRATARLTASKVGAWLGPAVPALLVALPALGGVWDATVRASWSSLGRDQGIFQYVAWAVGQGDVAYRDVRDVNGPVITMVHAGFQLLGGADEHRFRVLDLVCTGLSFAFAGALVPSIADGDRRATSLARAAWALAAWVALSAQYEVYGFWDTAQRESFLDWFLLASIALQATRGASGDPRSKSTAATLVAAGLASFVPWLGKPTFALFSASQIVALLVEPGGLRARARRLVLFLAGGAIGLAIPLAWVAARGDVGAWARVTFVDVPAMYRFIWPRPASAILSMPGYASLARVAVLTSLALAALIVTRRLPRRTLPVAAMPALGLVSVVVQAKGFPYHFHPVTLGVSFAWLVALAAVWERALAAPALTTAVVARRLAVVVAALVVGGRAAYLAWAAPYPPAPAPSARDAGSLESAARLSAFDRIDYFPRAMRDAAEYVAARTTPDDRVQTYAMDAYLLFLARRRSATPYIYAYDLNADAALHGSFDPGGLVPTDVERERIVALRDAHAADLAARLERSPPAAFVFVDRSPLMTSADAVADFAAHCPEVALWLSSRYRQTADFEGIRIWLRDDLAAREPEVAAPTE